MHIPSTIYPRTAFLMPEQLVDLLVRQPFVGLEILLLERRIQDAESPYLTRGRCVVAADFGFGLAVSGLQSNGTSSLFNASV